MKFSVYSTLAVLASLATATPTPTVARRGLTKRCSDHEGSASASGSSTTPGVASSATSVPDVDVDVDVDESAAAPGGLTDECTIGYGTGTTGGAAGSVTTVSSLDELTEAAEAEGAAIIVVSGSISGSTRVRVKSNKSIIGASGSSLTGVGLYVNKVENVILRNLKISKVVADNGDAIGIQDSSNVWVDHVDLSSDRDSGKDFYDGLLDITHGCMGVTVSNSYLHDHHKGSLVGHSDSNASKDEGKLHVTYANNYWKNIGSRVPSVRFGTVHIYNNYEEDIDVSGVNTRMGAQVLIESSVFANTKRAITSLDSKEKGSATVDDVDLGGSTNDAPEGSASAPSYAYSKLGSENVVAAVTSTAGQTLDF